MIYVLAIILGCGVIVLAWFIGIVFFTLQMSRDRKTERNIWFENLSPLKQVVVATVIGGAFLFFVFSIFSSLPSIEN